MDQEKPLIPNFTQIPNILLDKVMPLLNGTEFMCLMYIARRTYGFKKEQDRISYSQFERGIINKDGGTGMSRPAIATALALLTNCNLIVNNETTLGNIYKINIEISNIDEVVKKLNQLKNLTTTSKETLPQLVKKLNRQNKERNKGNKDSKKTCFLQDPEIHILIDAFKPVNPFYLKFYSNSTERGALNDLAETLTVDKVHNAINALPQIINLPYAPKITKPTELKRDYGKLIAFCNQQKSLSTNKTKIII